jgi:hypothetical protein
MKKVLDPDPICGQYRWDGRGGHARLNPHPIATEIEPGVIRVSRYLVWMDGINTVLSDASTLEEAQAVLDNHWGALMLGATNTQSDEELG